MKCTPSPSYLIIPTHPFHSIDTILIVTSHSSSSSPSSRRFLHKAPPSLVPSFIPPMALLFSILLLLPFSLSELLFVSVIWRHGDRAPGNLPYPLDPHNITAWPRGWNQLTNEGIKQTNDLGLWLRNRYMVETQHINGVFNKDEVLVRSSDYERSLSSAQSVMASLFPPEAEFVWKKGFTWQPIPIHSNGEDRDDPLLKPTSISCPSYDKMNGEESQALFLSLNHSSNYQFFQHLSKNTGMEITALNVDNLYDITREISHGLKQPDWVTDEVVERIKEFKRAVRTNEFDSQSKARFRGGYLLGDWHSRINAVSEGKKGKKTILYSSHDGTLSSLLGTMGVSNGELIPSAAAVIAELHRENGKDFVQLWFRNESSSNTSEPIQLTLPECDSSCPLSTFNAIIAPLTINSTKQLEEMCTSASPLLLTSLVSFVLYFVSCH